VPDWLSAAMLILGVGLRLLDHGLLDALIIAGITFTVLFMLWLLGFMGGGDVKLWTATVFIVPPIVQPEINFCLYITTFGGALALLYLLLGRLIRRPLASRQGALWRRALRVEAWRISNRGPLPYACAIAFGAFATLLPLSL
jgi:prepilin peptidase CpaA